MKERNGDKKEYDCDYLLPRKAPSPMSNDYCPQIDDSPELNTTDADYYQSLISILIWMAELGRVDICTEVSV